MQPSPTTSVWPVRSWTRRTYKIMRQAASAQKKRPGKAASLFWQRFLPLCLWTALRIITCAEPQAVQADEPRRVALVVPTLHPFHRRNIHIVEGVLRLPAAGDDIA